MYVCMYVYMCVCVCVCVCVFVHIKAYMTKLIFEFIFFIFRRNSF